MFIRFLILSLAGALSLTAPQAAIAQQEAIDPGETCKSFNWLLGTWHSYSPWGDHTEPTGGTLIFTMGAGGTAEGRIGTLNEYMEENGYTAGMVVYRGFREVHVYGPTGTTSHQSFDGQVLLVGEGVSEWRDDTVGVRHNGDLYMTSSAISHLSGHGPFRKATGVTQTRVPDRCKPAIKELSSQEREQPTIENKVDDVLSELFFDSSTSGKPVLLQSAPSRTTFVDNIPDDPCLEIEGVRNDGLGESNQGFSVDRSLGAQLGNLQGYGSLIGQTEDPELRAQYVNSYVRLLDGIFQEYYATLAERLMQPHPAKREGLNDRIRQIETVIKFDRATLDAMQRWSEEGLSLDEVVSFDGLRSLREGKSPTTIEVNRDIEECFGGQTFNVLDPLADSRSGPSALPTRAEQERAREAKLVQARRFAEVLEGLEENDPVRESVLRAYARVRGDLDQHASILRETSSYFGLNRNAKSDRMAGAALQEQLNGLPTLDELRPTPAAPALPDVGDALRSLRDQLGDQQQSGYSDEDIEAFNKAFMDSNQWRSAEDWLYANREFLEPPVFNDEEQYWQIEPNKFLEPQRAAERELFLQKP